MHIVLQCNAGVKRSIRRRPAEHNSSVNYTLFGSRLLLPFINHGLRAVIIIDRQNYSREPQRPKWESWVMRWHRGRRFRNGAVCCWCVLWRHGACCSVAAPRDVGGISQRGARALEWAAAYAWRRWDIVDRVSTRVHYRWSHRMSACFLPATPTVTLQMFMCSLLWRCVGYDICIFYKLHHASQDIIYIIIDTESLSPTVWVLFLSVTLAKFIWKMLSYNVWVMSF